MMDKLRQVGSALLILAGLNMGVAAGIDIDAISKAIGSFDPAEQVFYLLVGVAALDAGYSFVKELRS